MLAGDASFSEPGQVLADSGYGTGDLRNDPQTDGLEELRDFFDPVTTSA